MSNKPLSRILEVIWLIVGLLAGYASVKSFIRVEWKNGLTMLFCSVIGFAMFFIRRRLRVNKDND